MCLSFQLSRESRKFTHMMMLRTGFPIRSGMTIGGESREYERGACNPSSMNLPLPGTREGVRGWVVVYEPTATIN